MPGEDEPQAKKKGGIAQNIQKFTQEFALDKDKVKRDGTTMDERKFLLAAAKGDVAAVKKAMGRDKYIVLTKDQFSGYSALHFAVKTSNVDLVNFLVTAQHPVNITSRSGQTPLHEAGLRGHTAIADILIKAGADKDARDHAGFTYAQLTRLRSPPNRPKGSKGGPASSPTGRASPSLRERGRSASTREPGSSSPKAARAAAPRSPTKLGPGK